MSGVGRGDDNRLATGLDAETFAETDGPTTPVPKHRKQLEFAPLQVQGFPVSVIDVLLAGVADAEDIPRERVRRPRTFVYGVSIRPPSHPSIRPIEVGNLGVSVPVCRATMKHGAARDVGTA